MVSLPVPYALLDRRPQACACRQDQNAQSHRQQNLPPYFHQLVKAITRERATIPDVEVHERSNFHREPINILPPLTHGRDEQDQTNQSEDDAESSQANSLNPKKR